MKYSLITKIAFIRECSTVSALHSIISGLYPQTPLWCHRPMHKATAEETRLWIFIAFVLIVTVHYNEFLL